jgi:hypothetical protein
VKANFGYKNTKDLCKNNQKKQKTETSPFLAETKAMTSKISWDVCKKKFFSIANNVCKLDSFFIDSLETVIQETIVSVNYAESLLKPRYFLCV